MELTRQNIECKRLFKHNRKMDQARKKAVASTAEPPVEVSAFQVEQKENIIPGKLSFPFFAVKYVPEAGDSYIKFKTEKHIKFKSATIPTIYDEAHIVSAMSQKIESVANRNADQKAYLEAEIVSALGWHWGNAVVCMLNRSRSDEFLQKVLNEEPVRARPLPQVLPVTPSKSNRSARKQSSKRGSAMKSARK